MKKILILLIALLLLAGCSREGDYTVISMPDGYHTDYGSSSPQEPRSEPEASAPSQTAPSSETPSAESEVSEAPDEPDPESVSSGEAEPDSSDESSREEAESSAGEEPESSGENASSESSEESEEPDESGEESSASEGSDSGEEPEIPGFFPENLPQNADVLICVTASGTYGELSFYEKREDGFEEVLSCGAFVGAEGIGQASDWSTRTPQGLFPLRFAFGVEPDPGCPVGYVQVDDTHYWVGDSDSPYYNRFVSTRDVPFGWTSYEHLIEYPRSYAYAAWIEYNSEQTPGGGSAFFLHCDNGNPTEGCVAVSRENMVFILQNLTENTYIYITKP